VSQNVFVGGESYLDANGYCLIKVVVAVTIGVAIAIFQNKTMIKFATLIVSSFDE
jgi:flagellar biosynthesis protein FliQ